MAPARRDYDDDDDLPCRREDERDRPARYDDDDDTPRRRGDRDRPSRYNYADRSFRKDDHDDDDDYDRPARRRGGCCRFCDSDRRPYVSTQISVAGWIIFAVMLLFCTPLFFIGLLITEEVRTCSIAGLD